MYLPYGSKWTLLQSWKKNDKFLAQLWLATQMPACIRDQQDGGVAPSKRM